MNYTRGTCDKCGEEEHACACPPRKPSPPASGSPLAVHIARHIFKSFTEVHGRGDKCQRLQAKGGAYPAAETNMGGLCEEALVVLIDRALSTVNTEVSHADQPVKSKS